MVAERGAQVHALAEALMDRPILDGPDAEAIIRGGARPAGSEETPA
jgi:hypothetical protein